MLIPHTYHKVWCWLILDFGMNGGPLVELSWSFRRRKHLYQLLLLLQAFWSTKIRMITNMKVDFATAFGHLCHQSGRLVLILLIFVVLHELLSKVIHTFVQMFLWRLHASYRSEAKRSADYLRQELLASTCLVESPCHLVSLIIKFSKGVRLDIDRSFDVAQVALSSFAEAFKLSIVGELDVHVFEVVWLHRKSSIL
jgi:hypothetical protein